MKQMGKSIVILAAALLTVSGSKLSAQKPNDDELLHVRESVWRAWFAGDTKTVEALVPPETVVISSGEEKWKHQAEVLKGSEQFHAQGGRLVQLEFPHTEVQHFGDVAIVWSTYALELEVGGKRMSSSGRATEIFVLKDGHWTNPGWHTDGVETQTK